MGKEYQRAWDQVTLSPQADERIRAQLESALARKDNVVPLHPEAPHKVKKAARRTVRTLLIAAAVGALLTVSVYAAANHTGFFRTVFGAKGLSDTESFTYDSLEGPETAPGQSFSDVDPEAAEAALGDYVTDSGASVTVGDYTLTIESVLIDDNGIGAISYSVSDPGGLPPVNTDPQQLPAGIFTVAGDGNGCLITVEAKSGIYLDRVDILDAARTTDTELHAVYYFWAFAHDDTQRLAEDETLLVTFKAWEPDGTAEKTVEIPARDSRVPSRVFTCRDLTAHLSPLGLILDAPSSVDPEEPAGFWADEMAVSSMVIHYADGTDYTVFDFDAAEPVQNVISGGVSGYTGVHVNIFNRFVDAKQVASITCRTAGETLTFTPAA